MYYKVTNKDSEIYKKLHALRTKELQLEKDNRQAIVSKYGDFTSFYGYSGQSGICRVTRYIGFNFNENPGDGWKIDCNGFYKPDKKTKIGRGIVKFLSDLPTTYSMELDDILDVDDLSGTVQISKMYLAYGGILISLDSRRTLDEEYFTEITFKEYHNLITEARNKGMEV